MGSEELLNRRNANLNSFSNTQKEIDKGYNETERVRSILENTPGVLDELTDKFKKETKLNGKDLGFLLLAIGLQLTRQYFTRFQERLNDQSAAKKTLGHKEEHSERMHRYYNPSLEEIITNPVPFDANIASKGVLAGGGKLGHRTTAIGHDPILGLVLGTANIATSTLTTWNMQSYHIRTLGNRDAFGNKANTGLVLSKTLDKMVNQGIEGKIKIAASLGKEVIHLNSDVSSKNSLPLPFVSAVNPQLASELAQYGLDMCNILTVGKQATLAIMINSLIAMLHRLFCKNTDEEAIKLHEVKTRKILSYSNATASAINIAEVAVTKDLTKLDVGGLIVTIYRVITDKKFIAKVKDEFIYGNYEKKIYGDILN